MSTRKSGSKKEEQEGKTTSKVRGDQKEVKTSKVKGEQKEVKTSKVKGEQKEVKPKPKAQKPADEKQPEKVLDVAEGEEGMTAPPPDEEPSGELPPYNPWRPYPPPSSKRQQPTKRAGKASQGGSRRRASPKRAQRSTKARGQSPESKDEQKPSTDVKQFAFPYYKILSGASVAPVKMYPQKIVIQPNGEGEESRPRQWAAGLFQNTTLSVKMRLLRLLLIWLFFRMLNKQALWLSEKLDLGQPDPTDGVPKPPPSGPGEKYIKVFHEGTPNPFHMKVTPGMNPGDGFRPPPFK